MNSEDRRLPLTERILLNEKETRSRLFGDTVVIHINHCMENSFCLSEILNTVFCRAVFVGVPYNDRAVEGDWNFIRWYGKKQGDRFEIWQEDTCISDDETDFMGTVETMIRKALAVSVLPFLKEGKKLLVLEDGGYHYPVLRQFLKEHPEFQNQVAGAVEQTSSGTARCLSDCRRSGFLYPCASISRSDVKMYLESGFIGQRVVEELAGFLYEANTFFDYHDVILLGYGIIGRQVARSLDRRCVRIRVADPLSAVRRTAEADGRTVISEWNGDLFANDTILIGNTGVPAFSREMLSAFFAGRAKRLYLASSSSQDKEFRHLREMETGILSWPEGAVLSGKRNCGCYTVYEFSTAAGSKSVYLMADGLPVNFFRKDVVSLTCSVIDLIFAEMVTAGLALLTGAYREKNLWLLGDESLMAPSVSEQQLVDLWVREYGLSPARMKDAAAAVHPDGSLLRRRLLEE